MALNQSERAKMTVYITCQIISLTEEMASPLLQSACVPSVPGWGAPAWADILSVAEWVQILHSLDCDPMVPLVTYLFVTGNGRS